MSADNEPRDDVDKYLRARSAIVKWLDEGGAGLSIITASLLAEVARQDAEQYPWTFEMLAKRATMYRHETPDHMGEVIRLAAFAIREAMRLRAEGE